jgi:hypothetical protein
MVGSGDKLCGLLSDLFQAVAHYQPTISHLPLQALFTESSCRDQPPALSPFSHPLLCMSFPVLCLLFSVIFVSVGQRVSLSKGLYLFIPGVAVGILCAAYLLTCWSASPKQVWSQCLVAWQSSCFLSVMRFREALYRLGVWGVGVLLPFFVWFSSAKCGSSISPRFLIYAAHAVYFLPLVTILDPLPIMFLYSFIFLLIYARLFPFLGYYE